MTVPRATDLAADLQVDRLTVLPGVAALAGRRVLVTATNYAPEVNGSGPYTTDLAEHFARAGAHVRVVTAQPHYPQWHRPAGVRNNRHVERRNGVEVVRVPVYVPRDPTLLRRAVHESSFVASALPSAAGFKPQVVVACTPALFGGALGATVARARRVPYVVVVQDLITSAAEQSGMHGAGRAKAFLSAVERWTFAGAAHISVPSPAFVPAVEALAPGREVTVVPNWSRLRWSETDRNQTRSRLGWTERFVIAHTGNMGLKQGLDELAPTLRHMAAVAPDVLFSFVGGGSQRQVLLRQAAGLANVEIRSGVPDADYLAVLQAADLLLVNERSTVRDMSLPSKLTSYFTAAQPVLAVARPDSATAQEIRYSGAGLLVSPGDPSAVGRAVTALRAAPERMKALGAAGRRHAQERLAREVGLSRMADLVVRALN